MVILLWKGSFIENIVISLSKNVDILKEQTAEERNNLEKIMREKNIIAQEKYVLEKEMRELKNNQKQYILNVSNVVINSIIKQLEEVYQNNRNLNKQISEMQDFENWLNQDLDEINSNSSLTDLEKVRQHTLAIKRRFSTAPESFKFEVREIEIEMLENYEKNNFKINICEDCKEGDYKDDYIDRIKPIFTEKDNVYGYQVINKLSISLLPTSTQVKLENFLKNYSRKKIYQKPIYLKVLKWDYKYLKEKSDILQENIENLKNDLPSLKNELKIFFDKL